MEIIRKSAALKITHFILISSGCTFITICAFLYPKEISNGQEIAHCRTDFHMQLLLKRKKIEILFLFFFLEIHLSHHLALRKHLKCVFSLIFSTLCHT